MDARIPGANTWQYQTTPDNVTFTSRAYSIGAANTSANLFEIAYGGTSNRHVALIRWDTQTSTVCGTQTATTVRAIYSTDGVTWTTGDTVTLSTSSVSYSVGGIAAYSGGFVYIAYRSDGTNLVKHSVDGATWTDITANIASVAAYVGTVSAISYVNGRFILTTTLNQIYTSTTGASGSWTLLAANNSTLGVLGTIGKIRGNSNAYVTNLSGSGTAYFSSDLITWVSAPNIGLGNMTIFATPSTGTRFYGYRYSNSLVGCYLCDIYSYTTATQFVVPRMNTFAQNSQSSPYLSNNIPVNYLIKT